MERADEINEGARVRKQLQLAKEALADAHMELALEKAFLNVAFDQFLLSPHHQFNTVSNQPG